MGKKEQINITSLTTSFDALMLLKSAKFFYKLLIRLLCCVLINVTIQTQICQLKSY